MPSPDEAISAIHSLAAAEVWYVKNLNMGRGLKGPEKAMTASRLEVFRYMLGREPSPAERERLVWGDA